MARPRALDLGRVEEGGKVRVARDAAVEPCQRVVRGGHDAAATHPPTLPLPTAAR